MSNKRPVSKKWTVAADYEIPITRQAANKDTSKAVPSIPKILPTPTRQRRVNPPNVNPAAQPNQPPAAQPNQPPAAHPNQPPAAQPNQPPAAQPNQPPAAQPNQPPAAQPNQPPAAQPYQSPAAQSNQPPTAQPNQPPAAQPNQPPAAQPNQPPAAQPNQPPAAQPTLADAGLLCGPVVGLSANPTEKMTIVLCDDLGFGPDSAQCQVLPDGLESEDTEQSFNRIDVDIDGKRILDHLPMQLEIASPSKKFNVETRFEEAGISDQLAMEESAESFAISLTSTLVVEDQEQVDPPTSAPSDHFADQMRSSSVRYSGQMESSACGKEGSWTADETAGSYTDFDQQQFLDPSFQSSIVSDQGKAVYGIAVYPQQQPFYGHHNRQPQPKKQPAQPQVFFCEICRVRCAGPQQYAAHLNGQKHKKKKKKKENTNSAANRLYCELCDVTCPNADMFAAHVRGVKHLRVLNLHTMMGKPVPTVTMPQAYLASTYTSSPTSTPPSAPAFIPSSASASPAPASALVLTVEKKPQTERMNVTTTAVASDAASEEVGSETAEDASDIDGEEFVEEVRNDEGMIVSYNCKLCECSFRDLNGKRVHLKGIRHWHQYKKQIEPTVEIDVGSRHNTEDDCYMIEKHMDLYPPKEEMAEIHHAISAFENALKLVFDQIAAEDSPSKTMNLVETSEATVQSEEAEKTAAEKMATDELCQDAQEEMMETTAKETVCKVDHLLIKGPTRVGLLSKGLLLRGDYLVEHLVVICSERPTRSLLQRIVVHLPAQLDIVSQSKKFNVETRFEEAGLLVLIKEPVASFAVTLACMLIVKDEEQVDPSSSGSSDQLSLGHCLSALALLRHTEWFQLRLCATKAGTVVAHVLKDFCRRNGTWTPLSEWAQMLLVEKSILAVDIDIGPGDALRRFFACISSGILLPGGYGLMDPCEKVPTDVTAYLTEQQCEDITASAQQFLRQFVFHQLNKVLDVAQFKSSGLKRRREPDDEPEREDDRKLKQDDPAAVEGSVTASEALPVDAID